MRTVSVQLLYGLSDRRPGRVFRGYAFEVFGDLVQRLVFRLRQLRVHIRQADQADGAEQDERVVETGDGLQVQIEFGHQEAQDEVRGRTNAGPDVFASETRGENSVSAAPQKTWLVSRVKYIR